MIIVIIVPIITFLLYYYSIDRFVKNSAKEKINIMYDEIKYQVEENTKYGDLNKLEEAELVKREAMEIRKKLLREMMRTNNETIVYSYNKEYEETFITNSQIYYDEDFVSFISSLLSNYELDTEGFTNIYYNNKEYLTKLYVVNSSFNLRNKYYVIIQEITDKTSLIKENMQLLLIMQAISILITSLVVYAVSNNISKKIKKLIAEANTFKIGSDITITNNDINISEIDELSKNLYNMQKKLNDEEKEKNIIFENVTHDLRTPLLTIIGYADSIRTGINKNINEASDIIVKSGTQLKNMVENILVKTKIDNNTYKIKRTDFDLFDLIQTEIKSISIVDINKEINLISNIDQNKVCYINTDRNLFIRIIQNLLSNAIKYADKYIEVLITEYNENDAKNLNSPYNFKIEIKNDGKVINEADMKDIFDRNYKSENGNFGIGLNFVKQCLVLLGLEIDVQVIDNKTTFIINV